MQSRKKTAPRWTRGFSKGKKALRRQTYTKQGNQAKCTGGGRSGLCNWCWLWKEWIPIHEKVGQIGDLTLAGGGGAVTPASTAWMGSERRVTKAVEPGAWLMMRETDGYGRDMYGEFRSKTSKLKEAK